MQRVPIWYDHWHRAFRLLAARKLLVILLFGFIPIVINPLFSLFMGIPYPHGSDEFGYLLMADTFTHGRIANATHPLWHHFETFAEIEQPTRSAISPPMQGLFLAIGQILFNCPIAGVWISISLMCMAITWMLYAWMRPPWALAGSILALCNLGIYTYWSHSYWGGAPAAIGGCLVFGALRIVLRNPSFCQSSLLGLGCFILANSRPFEGFIVCLPVAAALIVWLFRSAPHTSTNPPASSYPVGFAGIQPPSSKDYGSSDRFKKFRIVTPLMGWIVCTLVQTGIYNNAITHNPFEFPQIRYIQNTTSVPMFLWQKPRTTPIFTNPMFNNREKQFYLVYYTEKKSSLQGFLYWTRFELTEFSNFYLGIVLLPIVLLSIPCFFRNRTTLFALGTVVLLLFTDALCLSTMAQPNYYAPLASLLFLLITTAFQQLYKLNFGRIRTGRIIIPVLFIFSIILSTGNIFINRKRPAFRPWHANAAYIPGKARSDIIRSLEAMEGKHLVIVRYHDNYLQEWVYNGADIDDSRVVMARELDEPSTTKLCEYFSDRRIWLLDIGDNDKMPDLTPFK